MIETKKTNCHFCGYLCGFEATVEDGRIAALKPDPTRYPYDPQILAGCQRWRMNLDVLDSPRRVNYPLKRTGNRGEGKWQRVSWDEALDDIAARLIDLKSKYGSGTLASMIGGPHTSFWPLHRLMSLFGSPNNVGIGQICWNPRIWMDALTFGWTIEIDITKETNTLIVWGTNPAESDNSVFWRSILKMSRKKDNQKGECGQHEACTPNGDDDTPHPDIVVIDPRYTKTARIADVWLAPRPGTDCTLALSFINVVIDEDLYDHAFVRNWCHGFDELVGHVSPYTPEYAAQICDVDAEDIRKVARMFARRPSALISGRGIDQIGRNVSPTHRARCILLAITGNVDRPGANCLAEPSDFVQELDLECTLENEDVLRKMCLNTPYTPLQCYDGYDAVAKVMNAHAEKASCDNASQVPGGFGHALQLPARYLTSAHPDLVLHAMQTGDPYRISALIIEATNPLLTYADTSRVYDALMSLDLLVVVDYYITPTAAIADYVLPSAGAMERATFQAHGGVANFTYGGAAACAPYYERKVDYEIFRELGMRLGQEGHWPHKTFEEACAYTLSPTGMDWDTYCEIGMCYVPPKYMKYLEPCNPDDPDSDPRGFATSTGKVELASEILTRLGGQRLPLPGDNRKLCSAGFIEAKERDGWHHVELITGARKQPYNASMYLDNAEFRRRYPHPLAEMSLETANDLGLAAGDCVVLATDNGQAYFKVAIDNIRYGLIHADYGWWHPEWDPADGRLGGIWESNINTLTSCSLDQSEEMIGTWSYNAIDCMVKKSDAKLSWDNDGFTCK